MSQCSERLWWEVMGLRQIRTILPQPAWRVSFSLIQRPKCCWKTPTPGHLTLHKAKSTPSTPAASNPSTLACTLGMHPSLPMVALPSGPRSRHKGRLS